MKNGYKDEDGAIVKPTPNQARLKAQEFIIQKAEEFKQKPPPPKGVEDGTGPSTSSPASTLPNYSGISTNELSSQIAQNLTNVTDQETLDNMFRQAENELYKRYREEGNMSAPEARIAAEEEMKRIRNSL